MDKHSDVTEIVARYEDGLNIHSSCFAERRAILFSADLLTTTAAGSRACLNTPVDTSMRLAPCGLCHTSYIRCRLPIPHQNRHRAISLRGIYVFGWTQVPITLQRAPGLAREDLEART